MPRPSIDLTQKVGVTFAKGHPETIGHVCDKSAYPQRADVIAVINRFTADSVEKLGCLLSVEQISDTPCRFLRHVAMPSPALRGQSALRWGKRPVRV